MKQKDAIEFFKARASMVVRFDRLAATLHLVVGSPPIDATFEKCCSQSAHGS